MVQETGTEAQFIKEAVWKYTQFVVVLLACIGAGVFIGYELWGNAPALKKELEHTISTVNRLKNERTDMESKLGVFTNRLDKCTKEVGEIKKQRNGYFQELQALKRQQAAQ